MSVFHSPNKNSGNLGPKWCWNRGARGPVFRVGGQNMLFPSIIAAQILFKCQFPTQPCHILESKHLWKKTLILVYNITNIKNLRNVNVTNLALSYMIRLHLIKAQVRSWTDPSSQIDTLLIVRAVN